MLSIFKSLFTRKVTEDETPVSEGYDYEISLLTDRQRDEVMRLNARCFVEGESYTRHTFDFLLSDANTISFRVITPSGTMVAFIFLMMASDGSAHVTTVGVAPEHRRRGLGERLMTHSERALRIRGISTLMLEVRVSNIEAQNLYRKIGYVTLQRLESYYNNGEDGFLMMKPLNSEDE
jgi:ribosomal-protein-alanine N-acetyltransferase